MRKQLLILPLFLFIISCSDEIPKENVTGLVKVDTVKQLDETLMKMPVLAVGLEYFSNIEQVDYCVPIPKNEYTIDDKNEYERAKFVFLNKKNPKLELIVQGMFRLEPEVSIDEYFKNSYPPEDEETGKIIQKKEIVKGTSCFYAKGYWSNFELDQRFIEVTWLRKDDLVKLQVTYDINDTLIWNERLKNIVETDSYCK